METPTSKIVEKFWNSFLSPPFCSNEIRKSGRTRKPVQQINIPAAVKSPRMQNENEPPNFMKRNDSDDASNVYIDLDPFAPPPRLSLSGMQSPRVDVTPSSEFQTPSKKTPAKQRREEPLAVYSGGNLFEQLSSPGLALKTVVDDWLQKHDSASERKETVALVLINLILWASRVEDDIIPENFVTESAAQILGDLQEKIEPAQAKTDFPLFDKSKKHRTFRSQFSDFWRMWASSVLPATRDLELIQKVILPWLISMSSAGYRPIRYAATLAVLDIVAGSSKACVSMQKELENASRVMNSKRGMASKRSAEATSARIAEIEKMMQSCIDAVFVQRYRDVDPMIREKCVEKMLTWIETYPEVFLDNAYLRYIGWSLSDKAASVRSASLAAWRAVCCRPEFRPSLANLVARFKARLLEVLGRDVDKSCRLQAGQVVDSLFTGGFLEAGELTFLDDLVYSGDATLSSLKAVLSQRLGLQEGVEENAEQCMSLFAGFLTPFMNSESSVEINNLIIKNFILNMRESLSFVTDMNATSALLKNLLASASSSSSNEEADQSEKISCLLAVLYAQVVTYKSQKGSWHLEHSSNLFTFVNDLVKFINDNECEIYPKDIFYLFALINEVEVAVWLDIAPVATWDGLLPILSELFCSIDDLESAKMALVFFKRAKSVAVLKDRVEEVINSGRARLCSELVRQIPSNMREALKIKDNSLLTLILPLSQLNLLSSIGFEDSGMLFSILDMTKLIDEFVTIDGVFKTMIWTSSVRLVFHELMWKLMEARVNPSDSAFSEILDIRDHLLESLNPADYVPEDLSAFSEDSYERLNTCVSVLADLALLFSQSPVDAPISWSMSMAEDQVRPLVSFVRVATRLTAEPLPSRDHGAFELSRLAKRGFSSTIASLAKLFSLEILPSAYLSTLLMTFGFGDEVADAVIRVVMERSVAKMNWQSAHLLLVTALKESYLLAVMSSEYERLVVQSTISLAKAFNEQLKQTALFGRNDDGMLSLHQSAIEFFRSDCSQRSEFMGRVMIHFTVYVAPKHCEELLVAMKAVGFSDSFTKVYCRALEKNIVKGSVAQRLLTKRINAGAMPSSPSATKSLKLDSVSEEADEIVEDIDAHTQLQDEHVVASPPPAHLKRKVVKY